MPRSSFPCSARRFASICQNPLTNAANASKRRRILETAAMFLGIAVLGAATLAAQTNFGSVAVGSSAPVAMTVTLTPVAAQAGATIGSISVLTLGAPYLDYTNAGTGTCATGLTLTSSQTCTVVVNFKPIYPGPRNGAVQLVSDSGAPMAMGFVQGIGTGPLPTFANTTSGVYLPSAVSTLGGFNSISAVAVDGSGNLYVTDSAKSTVSEIEAVNGVIPASPTIRTLGSGFAQPSGVAVDGGGNVFVADTGNNAVKEIEAVNGIIPALPTIMTLTGSGSYRPNGLAVDGSGNVFVASFDAHWIVEVLAAGGYTTEKIVLSGQFFPSGVAVDGSGDVFVADEGNNAVEEIVAANGSNPVVKTLVSGLPEVPNIAVDASGNLYVTVSIYPSTDPGSLLEILAEGGYTTEITLGAGTGPGQADAFAVDGKGNLFVGYDYSSLRMLNYAAAPTLGFATTHEGFTSSDSAQTVTVQNIGNQPLDFSAISYPTDFPEAEGVATDCNTSTPLAAAGSCTLSIDFSPLPSSLIGNNRLLAEPVSLTDNALNETGAVQSVAVSGLEVSKQPAVITSPVNKSTLTGFSATFSWTAGTNVTQYSLDVGTTGAGSFDIFSGTVSGLSKTVYGIPTNSGTVYVRLNSLISGTLQYFDYTYTEASPAAPAVILTPAPGSAITSTAVTFSWTTGSQVEQYILHVGTTGVGSNNIFSATVTGQAKTVTGIPSTGGTVYVRLYSLLSGVWQFDDSTYTVPTPAPAAMASPTPGSMLPSSAPTFAWSSGTLVQQYDLHVGTTGVGSSNLYAGTVAGLSQTVYGIPINSATVYVRLFSQISGVWQYNDYTYLEAGPAAPAVITAPASGSTLTGSAATFSWTAGSQVAQYLLHVGTTGAGSNNIFTGIVTGQSQSVKGIPTTGGTLYVRLYSQIAGAFQYADYTYTEEAPPAPATMTSPTPGSTLAGSSATFSWTAGSQVEKYDLHVGTTGAGSTNLCSATVTGQSLTLSDIPTTGGTLYVRLYSLIAGVWQYTDYTYTIATPAPAVMISPTSNSTLTGSTVTFSWTAGSQVTGYRLLVGTTGAYSSNIFSGYISSQSQVVTGIPTTGGPLYVTLYSIFDYQDADYQYENYSYTQETPVPAAMISPAPNSTLTGSTVTFSWTAGTLVTGYTLTVGTTGARSSDIFNGTATTSQSQTVTGIPTTGATLYVTLSSLINGKYQPTNYTYIEAP